MAKYKVVLGGIQWDLMGFDFVDDDLIDETLSQLPEEHECIVEADSTMEAIELAHDSATNGTGWCITDVIEVEVVLLTDEEPNNEA